jgi:hypothetical protein
VVLALVLLAIPACQAGRVTAPLGAGPPGPIAAPIPEGYVVEMDSVYFTPRWVRNVHASGSYRPGAPAPYTDAQAFRIVREFVRRNAALFKTRDGIDDFRVTYAAAREGYNIVKVTQTYFGLPLDHFGYGVAVLPNAIIGSMIGRLIPGIDVSTRPVVSGTVASSIARRALAGTAVTVPVAAELMISTVNDVPRLTWNVRVVSDGGFASWQVWVDAHDGAVLGVFSNLIIG